MKTKLATVMMSVLFSFASAAQYTSSFAAYPPFLDPLRDDNGLLAEIINEALSETGDSAVYTEVPSGVELALVRAGQVDFTIGVFDTEALEEDFLYSAPVLYSRVVFISPEDSPFEYENLKALDGLRVGVTRDNSHPQELLSYDGVILDELSSFRSLVDLLRYDGIDVILEDEWVARAALEEVAPDLVDKLHYSQTSVAYNSLRIVCRRTSPECVGLVRKVDVAIRAMRADGRIQQWCPLSVNETLCVEE